jgi:hypothetical protein
MHLIFARTKHVLAMSFIAHLQSTLLLLLLLLLLG